MQNITIEIIDNKDIELCRGLCNELMAFQKSKAVVALERFEGMSFDTRMKPSFDNALESLIILARDGDTPIGYAFSTVDLVNDDDPSARAEPEQREQGIIGFYPDWVELPQKIGRVSNLYLREQYRHSGVGKRLLEMSLDWLKSFSDVRLLFVYISNGNDAALDFYLKHGFTYSHEVFGGFIKAAYIKACAVRAGERKA